jgi:acyl CoA:acetate/3-ketoacid CoA transferase alpha subunit/acyl CoA:acetate/3-ketoacid CoA transferase beta subunit
MQKRLSEIIRSLSKPGDEGEDKVTTLEDAIKQNVGHGMTIHLGGQPSAALRQLLRQFWGQHPQFVLVGTIPFPYATSVVYCGMASKVITSAYQTTTHGPSTYPSRLGSTMPLGQNTETENWSLYSLEQRLMAGALGVGFMPTKSIAGSDMAKENEDSFQVIADPFDHDRKEGIVKALVPDLSLVHGCVADRYGNTILPLPHGDAIWGPRASRNGVVVTVEKIVSTDFIRDYPGLVKLPGYLVKSVCLAPLGAHPHGMVNPEVKGVEGYDADWEFLDHYAQAASTPETLNAWLKEWVADCPTQEDYLHKLGYDRVLSLKRRAHRRSWKDNLNSVLNTIGTSEQCNVDEMMIIAAAREIKETVVKNGYRTILAGAGAPELAACLAYHWLRGEGYGIDLLWGLGRIGPMPLPGQTNPMGISQTLTSKVLTDIAEIYGVVVGGRNARCISVLGAMQIDRFGNINNSRVGRISVGSGGAGDAINANETLVIVKHSPHRIVERVPYVTCLGDRVKTLVSSMGIFRKLGEDNEFTLTACFPNAQLTTIGERARAIRETCNWDLKIADSLTELSAPTAEELLWLRLFDSRSYGMAD